MISACRFSVLHGIANEEMFCVVPINMLKGVFSHELVACGAFIGKFLLDIQGNWGIALIDSWFHSTCGGADTNFSYLRGIWMLRIYTDQFNPCIDINLWHAPASTCCDESEGQNSLLEHTKQAV